jgi:uncharacterized protein YjbI with pentapeptide repeats
VPTQRRFALIIASDSYTDKKLTQLKAPIVDAKRLEKLLKDESIGGGYDVRILLNAECHIIIREIETFFINKEKDDLLLLYFAGHGHKGSNDGRLYLATIDSNLEKLRSTTIATEFIKSSIQDSKSSKIIVILDCCYSGAIGRGWVSRDDKTIHVKDEFREIESREKESGCVVLTSGTAMQYSWEGDTIKKEEGTAEPSSFYTNLLIKGIESGEADLNGDDVISCNEINEYIRNNMRENGHPQNPEIYLLKGDVTIANKKKRDEIDPSITWNQVQKQQSEYIQGLLQNGEIWQFNILRKKINLPIYLSNINLSGKDLQGIDLHDAILTESILKKTKLKAANLTEAKLTKADLTGADLRSAILYNCRLSEAKLIKADLRGSELTGMIDLSGADLSQADLRGVDFKGTVNFEGATLHDVDFTGANIDGVNLNLQTAKLKNVKGLKLPEASNKYSDKLKPVYNPLTILFLSANPDQTSPLELIKECNLINQKIRSSSNRELLKLEQRHDISIKWLIEELLNYNPQILHFSGHGSEKNALIFKNESTGEIEEIPPIVLSNLFKVLSNKIDLVFLNACYSEKQARAIGEHVKCVIGISAAISDIATIEFASTFYSSLGFGRSIEDSFDLAIVQLELLSIPESAIPKLIVKKDLNPSELTISGR